MPGAMLVMRRSAPGAPTDTVLGALAMEPAPGATEFAPPDVTLEFEPIATLSLPAARALLPEATELAPVALDLKPLAMELAPDATLSWPSAVAFSPDA